MRYKHHKRQLIPARCRDAYAQLVRSWLEKALYFYGEDNVKRERGFWVALDDRSPEFEFADGAVHVYFAPAKPSDFMLAHRSYDLARRKIKYIAKQLAHECRAKEERAVQELCKEPRKAK